MKKLAFLLAALLLLAGCGASGSAQPAQTGSVDTAQTDGNTPNETAEPLVFEAQTLDGETVMEDTLQFTYLQPGKVFSTEFDLSCCELKSGGRIDAFVHNASDEGSGIIRMEIVYEDDSRETVTFHITDHPE